VPVFIFDTDVLDTFPKPDPRLHFLIDAVKNLDTQLREQGSGLIVRVGKATELISQLMQEYGCTALYHNRSYGIGSQNRDTSIQKSCENNGHIYMNFSDYLLVEPGEVEQRKVFTPFFNLWKKKMVEKNAASKEQNPSPTGYLPSQGEQTRDQGAQRIYTQGSLLVLPDLGAP
jgi:deoxyribodipyrimidine photo-lyase